MSQYLPYALIPATGARSVFCFCDHASNYIPESFEHLGLAPVDQNRHIAWDIGAETVTRELCKTFGAGGILAKFSRLLIDANREVNSKGLIPEISDGTIVPGNQNLSAQEREDRIKGYYDVYHQALTKQLDALEASVEDPFIVSIHSFTPKPDKGKQRQLDMGLLWKVDAEQAQRVKAAIETVHPYKVGLNEPYSALELNYSMDRHVIPRGFRHTTLEIRQDLIDTDAKAASVALHLASALAPFINS